MDCKFKLAHHVKLGKAAKKAAKTVPLYVQ